LKQFSGEFLPHCDPGEHLDFWLEKFPSLLAHCYQVFDVKQKTPQLSRFYPQKTYEHGHIYAYHGCDLGNFFFITNFFAMSDQSSSSYLIQKLRC
jgi:hypothetical protein